MGGKGSSKGPKGRGFGKGAAKAGVIGRCQKRMRPLRVLSQITRSGLLRTCRHAGVTVPVSSVALNMLREKVVAFVKTIALRSKMLAHAMGNRTISEQHLMFALKLNSIPFLPARSRCK